VKHIFRFLGKEFRLPRFQRLTDAIQSLSFTEKILFYFFLVIFIFSGLLLLLNSTKQFLIEVPRFGGVHHEGVLGTPRSINPLLATSETDRDLTTLVYSGLMRITPTGELIPDLALDYTISEDGMEYLFTIRGDAVFHDSVAVTADDVVFPVRNAQDPAIKSPRRSDWEGVSVEQVSDREVRFMLPQPYSPFLFNTTLGILPKHIWEHVPAEEFPFTQKNIEPVGSGPYAIKNVRRNSAGVTERITLTSFDNFTLGRPYIKEIMFSFFTNEAQLVQALRSRTIHAINSISPDTAAALAAGGFRVESFPLPRVFAVFFNQSQAPILISKSVRLALQAAIDQDEIIDEVLAGFGTPTENPIPPHLIPFTILESSQEEVSDDQRQSAQEKAITILTDAGFSLNENGIMERETEDGVDLLMFTISTADVPELVAVAEQVVRMWKAIGADVNLRVIDRSEFVQNTIRTRRYDAILFGQVIGRDLDFYPFWHSSQRTDPGLNVSDYANIDVDAALADIRTIEDSPERVEKLRIFMREIANDAPAAFLYSPDFLYIVPEALHGVVPKYIGTPSDRFLSVYNWYVETDTVWSIFR